DRDVLFYDPHIDRDERVTEVTLGPNESVVGISIDPDSGTLTTLSTDQRVILYDRSLDPRSRTLEVTLGPNETVSTTTTRGNNSVTVTSSRIITFDGTLDPRDRQIELPIDANETVVSSTVTGRVNVFVTSNGRAILYDRTLDPRDRFSIAQVEGVDPTTTTVAAEGDDNVAIVTGTAAYVYDGSLDPRSRLQEVPLDANETVLGVSVMGNRFIWATDGRAIAYDGSKDPPFIEGDLPGGDFVAASGQGVAGVVATTGGVAIYDPSSGQWLTKDMDGVTGVIAADDIIIIQTQTGVSMYDRRFDPRSDPIEAPIGGDARFFAQRNTGMAFVPGEAAYYNVVDGKWYSVPPLANDTWLNGTIGNRTAVVCGEKAAAVWDPTVDPRNGWQVLNVGGDTVVSVTPSSRGFIVNTETKSYLYDRGRSQWIERDEQPDHTSTSGGRGVINCRPADPAQPEPEPAAEVEEPLVVDEGEDGGTDGFDEPPPLSTGDRHSIILVIDATGSMADNGKIDQAKSAATGLLQGGLPEGNEVGLVIFYDCGSIEWVPFTADYPSLLPKVESIVPSGSTPIADSIAFAAEKMATEGSGDDGRIILLTDGGENCSGDPIEAAGSIRQVEVGSRRTQNRSLLPASPAMVARDPLPVRPAAASPAAPLAQDGNIRLDVIGFQLDEPTATAMREVARAGGGGYLPAENANDLSKAFARLTRAEVSTEGDDARTWGAAGGGMALFLVLSAGVLKLGRRHRPRAVAGSGASGAEIPGSEAIAGAPSTSPVESAPADAASPAGGGATTAPAVSPSPQTAVPEAAPTPAVAIEPDVPELVSEQPSTAEPSMIPPLGAASLELEIERESPLQHAEVPEPEALPATPTFPATPAVSATPPVPAKILVISGHSDALVTELGHRRSSVGSDPENEVVVAAPGIARFHAEIRLDGNEYAVYAIGDARLTVNGEQTLRRTLVDGDEIALGEARLVFRWPERPEVER
ncbi:MAG: VWA domain-containing protein, partial [Acidimicrobiales bacterium]|nr:VWA domain-containing protein [Acidimicrobiales bacterium]